MEGLMQTGRGPELRKILGKLMPGGPADLCEIASTRAINELICNWIPALDQGHQLPSLAQDVDTVVEILTKFKAQCLQSSALSKGVAA